MAQKKRRKDMPAKPHRSRKPARSPLNIGERVRVKDGVLDPDYEGQSIGGWTGTIIDR
jgi:hypothetical protein